MKKRPTPQLSNKRQTMMENLMPKPQKPVEMQVDVAPAKDTAVQEDKPVSTSQAPTESKPKSTKKPAAKKKRTPPEGKKRFNLFLTDAVLRRMKIKAFETGMTGSEYIEEVLRKDLNI